MSNKSAPVSACIAAYNAEAFVGRAIESVKAQSLPVSELIVVDDSTDRTPEIAASMGATVFNNDNRGLAAARNRCVRESSQPWIAFLDSDDIWEPDKIERQMELVSRSRGVAVITCDYQTFDESTIVCESALGKYGSGYQSQPKRSCGRGQIIDQLDHGFADAYYFLLASNVVLRREVLAATGLFDENLYSADDFDCFMRMLAHHDLGVVEAVLVRRRLHEHNTSVHHPKAALSCLAATHKVLENPDLYPAATVKLCAEWLPENLRHAGASLIANGEPKNARNLLLESLTLKINFRTILALGASLPPALVGRKIMRARNYASRTFGI